MDNILYLCRIEAKKNQGGYIVLLNETPKKVFDNYARRRNSYIKDNYNGESEEELDALYRNFRLVSFEQKEFNYICVIVEISHKAREFRTLLDGRDYDYLTDDFIERAKRGLMLSDMFNISNLMNEYTYDEVKQIEELINDNSNISILKRIKGKYIHLYYLFDKSIKYSNVIDLIKDDFKDFDEHNDFRIPDIHKKSKYLETIKCDLNKLKKEKYIIVEDKLLGKYDLIWLENKLGISIDSSKFTDLEYIKSLKKSSNKNKIESEYLDLTNKVFEGEGSGDEIAKLTKEERKNIDDYKKMILKNYKINIDEYNNEYFLINHKDIDEEILADEEILHVVKDDDKIILKNVMKYKQVPKGEFIYSCDYIRKNGDNYEIVDPFDELDIEVN